MATIDVKDAAGAIVAIEKPLAPSRAAAALSRPVALSTEDKAALDALATEVSLAALIAANHTDLAAILAKLNVGSGVTASASFTPAAAAYLAGDLISIAQEFAFTDRLGNPVPSGSLIRILTTIIKIDATAVISGETSYSLPLYSVTPPSAQADNAAWTLASADLSAYRGTISLGTPIDLGAALYVKTPLVDIDVKLTGTGLFGELITAGGFTATAVARQVLLYGIVL